MPNNKLRSYNIRLFNTLMFLAVITACGTISSSRESLGTMPITPIKHLIVIIGENHSFDNVFGVYKPVSNNGIDNLLFKGIVKEDGTPGQYFEKARQKQARNENKYNITPDIIGPYETLPRPNTTTASGLTEYVADERFPNDLPNGPFQITRYVPYNAFTGDPVHRFFQMWQQIDSGKMDLFVWVAETTGTGPQNSAKPRPGDTKQGALAMGFYNMLTGDVPYLRYLADIYAINDNYHQAIMGGTGANFFSLVTADVAFYNRDGKPETPHASHIENPNPQPGTNNFYLQDGYDGGSYTNCADETQPGIAAIREVLNNRRIFKAADCVPTTYYLVNNFDPGFTASGEVVPLGENVFRAPPQYVPTIVEALASREITWKWYSGGRKNSAKNYCAICDPLTFSHSIMTSKLKRRLQDIEDFYVDIALGTLPAISFLRPDDIIAGHPADSTLDRFESFVRNIVDKVAAKPSLWRNSAIFITMDEGGGYYDSGYVQLIDFFGDGTRVPFIVVSPYAKRSYIDHTYSDHASILKFIEKNWRLNPLSNRSRDNLPNPILSENNPYIPVNEPAIGDLMEMFQFNNDK